MVTRGRLARAEGWTLFENWSFGLGIEPLVDLGVAIGEGKPSGTVVIGSRNIIPGSRVGPGCRSRHVATKQAVVNSVRMLVNEDPGCGRTIEVGFF